MLKNSQLIRFMMAGGMYLLLMWGYMQLPSAQWFAAFSALILSVMLIFWVTEPSANEMESKSQRSSPQTCLRSQQVRFGVTMTDWGGPTEAVAGSVPSKRPSLQDSVQRLDALKTELTLQYAQFGRDQSLLNSKGLGSWHGNRSPRTY